MRSKASRAIDSGAKLRADRRTRIAAWVGIEGAGPTTVGVGALGAAAAGGTAPASDATSFVASW
jgi:hypothetical protein